MHLGAHYREAAERLVGRTFLRAAQDAWRLLCFAGWKEAARNRTQHRIFRQDLRTRMGDHAARLCSRISSVEAAMSGGRCFLAWAGLLQEHYAGVRHAFGQQARGLARRLVELNSGTYGFATLAAAMHGWRRITVGMGGPMARLLSRRQRLMQCLRYLAAWRARVQVVRGPIGRMVSPGAREVAEEEFLEMATERAQMHALRRTAFAEAALQLRLLRLSMGFGAWAVLVAPPPPADAGARRSRFAAAGRPLADEPAFKALASRRLQTSWQQVRLRAVLLEWLQACVAERARRIAPRSVMDDVLFALMCLHAWRAHVRGGNLPVDEAGQPVPKPLGRRQARYVGLFTAAYLNRTSFVQLRRAAMAHGAEA
uniref:Uncharacterized protein n=1 Tax=Zooxanthella nutricula TaxID=1333877 RepID=A0A7S2IRK5_9DINO